MMRLPEAPRARSLPAFANRQGKSPLQRTEWVSASNHSCADIFRRRHTAVTNQRAMNSSEVASKALFSRQPQSKIGPVLYRRIAAPGRLLRRTETKSIMEGARVQRSQ
jgi:hypothetical protein